MTSMLKHILDLLKLNDYNGISPYIDIAKGKYEAPSNLKEAINKTKRFKNG
ncbi:MAG: hypothetical protein Unbinned8454contig1000_10 [Prokaryotic dsDNA virus sp.]|nr:MAG: hypothetical protein Unbinned8454contig1000_10 [Prokaryotic dsDNA virus sp.]